MDVFNGNKNLEQRIFFSLNWGMYMKSSFNNVIPFIFVYKENKKIKTILIEESDDDLTTAVNILKKVDYEFDQFVLGYETNIMMENNQPFSVIAVKGFNLKEDKGVFFVQKFKIDDQNSFQKINKSSFLGFLDLPFEKLSNKSSEVVDSENNNKQVNFLTVEIENKIKPIALIRKENESEIGFDIKDFMNHYFQNEANLSGQFDIDIMESDKINLDFLKWIIKDSFYDVISSEFVINNYTKKMIRVTLKATYKNEVIFEESTNDAINQLEDLVKLINKDNDSSTNQNKASKITTEKKRPTAITIICVMGFIGAVFTIPLIFSHKTNHIGSWYPAYLILSSIIGFLCMIGLWNMKKWAAYTYTSFVGLNQIILITMGVWNPISLIIPAIVVGVVMRNLNKMD
jgi:hypothetical protein